MWICGIMYNLHKSVKCKTAMELIVLSVCYVCDYIAGLCVCFTYNVAPKHVILLKDIECKY